MAPFPTIPDWISLEHQVAQILTEQELYGWSFDERAAQQLASSLYGELQSLSQVLRDRHPTVAGATFYPKRTNAGYGYYEGCESVRLKDFNPTSRDHIAWVMQTHYGWTPTEFTDKGKPTIDETVLKEIGTPIALQFFRCLELTKALGMLSEGINAWLKLVKDGRIHHHCSVATNTHRCSHRKPNLAQVPAEAEFRRLFTATEGMTMVGADLSGIELRMLAHYLARYDDGRYAEILLNGDIHSVNAKKIGIDRRAVKTITYAFLYGAGDIKIGYSYDPLLEPTKARKKGKEIRQAYMDAIPGLERLVGATKKAAERGFIKAIDGRKLMVDSGHKALNYLLQGSAAVIAKRWIVITHDTIKANQIKAYQLGFIQDEIQFETTSTYVNDLKFTLLYAAQAAGEHYNMRCPVAAESGSGPTWADTH